MRRADGPVENGCDPRNCNCCDRRLACSFRRQAAGAIAGGVCRRRRFSGCILTKDLPDPALDIPEGYKAARPSKAADAPPTLDWWRGFRSRELTALMEEAQTANLDIAATAARIEQADAQARIAGAPLLPRSTAAIGSARSSRARPEHWRRCVDLLGASTPATRSTSGARTATLRAAEETAIANRFDREVVALSTVDSVLNTYFQILAAQDRLRIANENIASAARILDVYRAALDRRHRTELDIAQQESVLAQPARASRRCDQRCARTSTTLADPGVPPPGRERARRKPVGADRSPRVTPGPAVRAADAAPGYPPTPKRSSWPPTANVGKPRAQFPSIIADRAGRLSEPALTTLFHPQAAFYRMPRA